MAPHGTSAGEGSVDCPRVLAILPDSFDFLALADIAS